MNLSTKQFWSRGVNKLYTFLSTKFREKTFNAGENRIKYMFFQKTKKTEWTECFSSLFPCICRERSQIQLCKNIKTLQYKQIIFVR